MRLGLGAPCTQVNGLFTLRSFAPAACQDSCTLMLVRTDDFLRTRAPARFRDTNGSCCERRSIKDQMEPPERANEELSTMSYQALLE